MNTLPADQVEELKAIHSDLEIISEAGQAYILLKGLNLPDGCTPNQSDVLFYPDSHHGYEARLFFPKIIKSREQRNWHVTNLVLFSKSWNAYSWKLNASNLTLVEMFTILLGALR